MGRRNAATAAASEIPHIGVAGFEEGKVVMSRSDQRIDRPLLPERPSSGRLVSGTRGPRWCRWPCGCPRSSAANDRCPTDHTWAPAWTRNGPCGRPANKASLAICAAAVGTGDRHFRRQCSTSKPQRRGRRLTAVATRPLLRDQERCAVETTEHRRCLCRPCRPGFGHSRTLRRVGCRSGGALLQERFARWRPLLGCSQRQWTRASRAR